MALVPVRWRCGLRGRRFLRTYICLAVLGALCLGAFLLKNGGKLECFEDGFFGGPTTTTTLSAPVVLSPERLREAMASRQVNRESPGPSRAELRMQWLRERIERNSRKVTKNNKLVDLPGTIPVNNNVQIFYYAWYETPAVDQRWKHWNHEYLPSWKPNEKKSYPIGTHAPPTDIGSNFYPQLGCYSSRDPLVIDTHMQQIRSVGVGVLVVSWYPPGFSDGSSQSPDTLFRTLLDAAARCGLKVAPHIEPYTDRNPINFLSHLKYFHKEYGGHPALYKMHRGNKMLPLIYVYDSYRTPAVAWRELLSPKGNLSLRGTADDAIFLGLLVDMQHRHEIKRAHFDGFYTYFASNGFSYGSSWKNWKLLSKFAIESGLVFVPSVGPGYIDTQVRPWNGANTRHRRRGSYYEVGWRSAMAANAPLVSITSFNEWHEGTQIEPAVPFSTPDIQYLDYQPDGPLFYLNLTRWWVHEFTKQSSSDYITPFVIPR